MTATTLYGPLPYPDSIRLFYLTPNASHDASLVGKLIVGRRSECQQYRALSYMWGPPDPSTDQELSVNGHILHLRCNLASTLRAYREHLHTGRIKGDLPLWIDLICIQQDNVQDKNQQVQQMGAIYEQAKSVLVWLGDSTKVDILDCFHGTKIPMNLSAEKPKNIAELRLLYRSLLNKHWTRTWILQELCLAQRIAIFTDKCVFRSKVLEQFQTEKVWVQETYSQAWHASAEHPNPHAIAVKVVNRFCRIWSARESRLDQRWKPLNLCSTIYALGGGSECSHHRDKVFAFLQMSANNANLAVDYERDETLIFWDVLASIDYRELSFHEIDSLREILQLSWRRLLQSTFPNSAARPTLEGMLLPCYLDCGTITAKVSRSRPPPRSSKKITQQRNCWFQTESTSAETMVQMTLRHFQNRTYEVVDIKYCPIERDKDLYGNLLESPALLQVVDVSWLSRWETVAVSPQLFVVLGFLASLDPHNFEEDLRSVFTGVVKTQDRHFRIRKATKRSGAALS